MNKETYYLYGKIRHIVCTSSCIKMTAKEVKDNIKENHYELIHDFYGLDRESIDEIINKVTIYPPSENSKKFLGV